MTKHNIKFLPFDRYEGSHHEELESSILIDGEDLGSIRQSCSWISGGISSAGDRKKVEGYTINLTEYLAGDENAEGGTTVFPTLKAARDEVRRAVRLYSAVIADVEDMLLARELRRMRASVAERSLEDTQSSLKAQLEARADWSSHADGDLWNGYRRGVIGDAYIEALQSRIAELEAAQ